MLFQGRCTTIDSTATVKHNRALLGLESVLNITMDAIDLAQPSFRYHVRLFGGLAVTESHGGQSRHLTIPGGSAQALLAYLLVHPQVRHARERLGELFWPDASPERMRRTLSDLLYRLRQALGADWFMADAETVALYPDLDLAVDVWQFEAAIKSGAIADLEWAVELYRGELLPELYADWLSVPRIAFQESYFDALRVLAADAERQRTQGRALLYYRQLVQSDPLHEEGYQGMMRVLAGQGRIAEALTIYDTLAAQLQRELNLSPSATTQRLARQLRVELDARQEEPPPQPIFVGRRQERAVILGALERLAGGIGGVVAVEGDAGMGKSHLLQTIADSAHWRQIVVAMAKAPPMPADSPFAPLRQLLDDALAPPRATQVADLLSADLLAALAPLHAEWQSYASHLIDLPADRALDRFHSATVQLLKALSEVGPHLLILDDAHWIEPALWRLLDTIVPVLADCPLLLVLAYRRPPIQQGHAWRLLHQWELSGSLIVVPLAPFTVADVAQVVPSHLRPDAERIHAATGGNPFYIKQLLLNIEDETSAPEKTVAQRVLRLEPKAWLALEAAAVLADPIPYRLWRALTEFEEDELAAIGKQLGQRVLLQAAPDGYAFVHTLIQEAIYEQIPIERRRQLHRRVADLLAQEPSASPRLQAQHLDRAGAGDEAAMYYRKAGELAMAQFAYVEAQNAFERALALMAAEPSTLRVETLLDLAHVCEITGDRAQQKQVLDEALAQAEQVGNEPLITRSLVALGNLAARTGEHNSAHAYLEQALARAHQHGDRSQELAIELILGDLLWRRGDPKAAYAHFETALALARGLGDAVSEGRALEGLGWALSYTGGDAAQAFALYTEALAVQQAAGDQLGAARTLLNMLNSYQNIGAWDRLYALADEAVAAQRQVSYRLGEAVACQSLGLAAYALGDYGQAESYAEAARQGFEQVEERMGVLIATDTLGLIAMRRGDAAQAEQYFVRALEIATSLDASHFRAFVQQDYGIFLLEQDRYGQSIDLLREAIANWRSSGERLNLFKCEAALGLALLAQGHQSEAAQLAEQGWQTFLTEDRGGEELQSWYWLLVRLQDALGNTARVEPLLDAAYAELLRQAGALADPTIRRRFFADVPLNAAIVAAHDQRTGMVRQRTAILARADAPLGRRLLPEETVKVIWTVHAPEDDLIADRTARRRAALIRLVQEAAAHDAIPTDQDLAAALGVSRRTILRDFKALADQGLDLPTRARR